MLKKFIHFIFLPCSVATLLMEKRNSGALSPKESWQLSMHLKICKWCKAYEKKLKILDEILKRTLIQEEKNKIDTTDIQNFKDEMIRKMDF